MLVYEPRKISYNLKNPIQITKDGDFIEGKNLVLKEPLAKYKGDLFELESLLKRADGAMAVSMASAVKDLEELRQKASEKNKNLKQTELEKKQEQKTSYENALAYIDHNKLLNCIKKILIDDEVCFIEGMKLTKTMFEQISFYDTREVILLFLLEFMSPLDGQ